MLPKSRAPAKSLTAHDATMRCVLNKAEIEALCGAIPPLVQGWDRDYIQPASYDLRLGEVVRIGPKWHQLGPQSQTVVIPPFEVAYVQTLEKLNMPNDLVASLGLRLGLITQGILLPAQPFIDPGYHGPIICLMFNLSEYPVPLRWRDHILSIEFRKTADTPPYDGMHAKEFSLYSALAGQMPVVTSVAGFKKELDQRIGSLEAKVDNLATRAIQMVGIILTAISVTVALLVFVISLSGVGSALVRLLKAIFGER
jgi:deoxycytidine triphosphate deaminase